MMDMSFVVILNGVLVFLIGQIYGIVYGRSIARSKSPQMIEAWRMAHSSICMGGISKLVFGILMRVIHLGFRVELVFGSSLIISAYAFAMGTGIAACSGNRGLTWKGRSANRLVFSFYFVASITSIVATLTFLYGIL